MAYIIQKEHKDCVVNALANYTGKDYQECLEKVSLVSGKDPENILSSGTPTKAVEIAFFAVTGKIGRPSMSGNGIAIWSYRANTTGAVIHRHCNVILDGHVFDTNGKIWTIPEWRSFGWTLYKIYR